MFVVDIAGSSAAISAVHGEVFGAIRPAATMVEVSALMDPSLLVEIEAEARRG
jgi:enamine deaminase RidA (YjgF/YER057c/UK114 family)